MEQSGRLLERSGTKPGEAARWGNSMVTEDEAGMSPSNKLRVADESGKVGSTPAEGLVSGEVTKEG